LRSAIWVYGGVVAAIVAGAATGAAAEASPSLPAGLATFGPSIASAIVLAVVFARHPAEGLAAFLLLDLVVITVAHWFSTDFRVIDEAFVVLVVALVLVRKPTLLSRRPGWKEAALGSVVVAGVLSSVANDVPSGTWIPGLLLLTKASVFYYAVRATDLDTQQVGRVSGALLAAATVILVLGFWEFADRPAFQQILGLPRYEAVRGDLVVVKSVFLHPALYGWLTAFASLFLYARFAVVRSWWALGLGLLFNLGTLLSFRRRPLLGILAALGVGAIAEGRRSGWWPSARRPLAAGIAIVAVLLVLAAPWIRLTIERTLAEYLSHGDPMEILADEPRVEIVAPTQPRVALYVGAVAITRDHFPLGVGLGRYGSFISGVNYSPVYAEYGMQQVSGIREERPVAITDVYWAMVLGETGVVGTLGMAAFLGLILVGMWRSVGRARSPAVHAFVLGAMLVFIEGLVGSATASTFVAAPIAFWVFGAAGAAESLARSEDPESQVPDARPPWAVRPRAAR
jgi:hypothetical protein